MRLHDAYSTCILTRVHERDLLCVLNIVTCYTSQLFKLTQGLMMHVIRACTYSDINIILKK